jgi:hypothetical protein
MTKNEPPEDYFEYLEWQKKQRKEMDRREAEPKKEEER